MSTVTTVVGVAVAALGYQTISEADARLGPVTAVDDWVRSDVWKWVAGLALVAFVLVIEKRSLASVGVRAPVPLPVGDGLTTALRLGGVTADIVAVLVWSMLGFVGTTVVTTAVYRLYETLDLNTPEGFVSEQANRGVAGYTLTAVSAGVMESLAYQGYIIPRLGALSGSVTLAAVVSWLTFTLVHGIGDTFDAEQTLYIGVPAAVLTVLFVACESVIVVCLVHSVVNLVSFLSE